MTDAKQTFDPFHARDSFDTGSGEAWLYRLTRLEDAGLTRISALPFSIRLLLESVLRNCDGYEVTEADVHKLAQWKADAVARLEIPFKPARVLLQDFTGVPCVVDLAAMRSAIARLGGKPAKINPLIPVDLVIDHSVQVDHFGSPDALTNNVGLEFLRNRERYEFLKWGQKALDNFRVVPPSVGIVHQVNLEFLAKGVFLRQERDGPLALPDTLVGTDSHTTMINGLGVLGWGVGGIEAEAVMLGQPLYMLMPDVIGFELSGKLPPGATATDLVLTVTQILRREGVVGKFVEFFGPGVSSMTVADRATIANMSPEYGATMGFFPVDQRTLDYLHQTGRTEAEVQLVERYAKQQQLFRTDEGPTPCYTKVLRLDLGTIEPSLAGPKRPQDRVPLRAMKAAFRKALAAPVSERGFALSPSEARRTANVVTDGHVELIGHGTVVIAAITSCTNTSNPSVMLGAGLLAQKAVQRGLTVKPYVKTSLAPGSRVVTDYLERSGLDKPLDALGFQIVGYGCTTCIGNSGPLPEPVAAAVVEGNLVAAAVLSGNRNFEGRIHPLVKANYLASPPLVVAYALAGTTDIDLANEPLGVGSDGQPVYLREIWPTDAEVEEAIQHAVRPEMFRQRYASVIGANPQWNELPAPEGELYQWNPQSAVHPGAAVSAGPGGRAGAHPSDPRRPGAVGAGRLGDHGPHLAGRPDRLDQSRGQVPSIAGGQAGGLQQLRLAARQRPRDDAGHLRQYPHPQPGGPGDRRRRHPPLARRCADDGLRRRRALSGGRRALGGPGRRRVRQRQQPRLGRQGNLPAGHPGGDRRELRANPPQQPGGHGRAAPGASRRDHLEVAGPDRRGDLRLARS